MKSVRCNFKNITNKDRDIFKKSDCLLTISIGQQTHEDARFIATINLIKESFKHCTIAMHDTLQRYTMALGQSKGQEEVCYEQAYSLGTEWLERNHQYFAGEANQFTITRWDEWLNHPDLNEKKELVLLEIERDPAYAALFGNSQNEFLDRYSKRLIEPEKFDRVRAERLCFDYLVEECAVLCLWPTTKSQFEIYAGTHNDAMVETRKRFVHSIAPDLIRSVSIGFNHRPDLAPQQFTLQKRA